MKLKIEVSNNAYNNAKHQESHSKNYAEIIFRLSGFQSDPLIFPFDIGDIINGAFHGSMQIIPRVELKQCKRNWE